MPWIKDIETRTKRKVLEGLKKKMREIGYDVINGKTDHSEGFVKIGEEITCQLKELEPKQPTDV